MTDKHGRSCLIGLKNVLQGQKELSSLKAYLADTDYIYPKCMELGLDVDVEYAEVVSQRKLVRNRIQELEVSI